MKSAVPRADTQGSDVSSLYHQLAFGVPSNREPADWREALKNIFSSVDEVSGYQQKASQWLTVIIATILLSIIAVVWIFLATPMKEGEYVRTTGMEVAILILVKSLVILVPLLFLLRFSTRNYRINKHLEVVFSHRWVLQRSIHAYLQAVGPEVNKEKALEHILPFFYNDIETGFITKKDGLGDHSIEVVPQTLIKAMQRR